ncbi:LTA synthase family protein [Parasaccharibacter sp. TMW 2.1891]|nr:LTA synthase family protein [Parasaccharibacter sp. TMW 2.1891]
MSYYITELCLMIVGSLVIGEGIDLFVHPVRIVRKPSLVLLRCFPVMMATGIFLCLTGVIWLSLLLSAILMGLLVTASNLKLRLLNEPLVFTDFALIDAFMKHPRFYLQGIPPAVRCVVVAGGAGVLYLLAWASSLSVELRLMGCIEAVAVGLCLWWLLARGSRSDETGPDVWRDVREGGLLPTLLLYAWRCHELAPLPVRPALLRTAAAPESVIVIQCESFADPAELKNEWSPLPELVRCRQEAVQWGRLLPSGLGAYTMRSEYGVLCGDDEEMLSYRRFDPFLTADQSPSHALPNRLKHFYETALFLHPYDLRFYGRNRLLPLWGFNDVIGRECFSEQDRVGPYVGDAALTARLLTYLQKNDHFLAYCVTIENHGPWKKGRLEQSSGAEAWHQHVQNGDAMLRELLAEIKGSGRDIMLVFFGDHRPALEALPAVEGLERGTPYVILRPNGPEGSRVSSEPVDVTPAELHRSILHHVSS